MSATCDIPTTQIVDEFDAPPFENTAAIEWMHETSPRFGHSKNLLSLMQGTEEEQKDYIRGLIASSIAMFCFFLVWVIFLFIFKCMGPSEAGVLSGTLEPFPGRPREPKDLEEWERKYEKKRRRLRYLRGLVVFAGISIIVSAILMSVNGVESLTYSLRSGKESIATVQDLTRGGLDLLDQIIKQNEATGMEVDALLEDINSVCPNVRDPICTDLSDVSTCNFDGIFDVDALQDTLRHFADGERSVYYGEIFEAKEDLEDFLEVTKDLDERADTFNWALYSAMFFSTMLGTLCLCILVGIVFRWSKIFTILRHWVLVPAFSVLVICSFVFSIVFVIGSMALADLCIDSPDDRILVVLNRFKEDLSPMLVDFATFYISHCPPELIPQELAEQLQFVVDSVPTLGDFSTLIEASTPAIQAICGFEDPSSLIRAAETTNAQLCDIAVVLQNIRDFFQCRQWYPLYESSVHNSICYGGTTGFAWVATTQFVVVFMAVVILTFRGVFYNLEIAENEERSGDLSSSTKEDRDLYLYSVPTPRQTSSAGDNGFELTQEASF